MKVYLVTRHPAEPYDPIFAVEASDVDTAARLVTEELKRQGVDTGLVPSYDLRMATYLTNGE